MPEGRITAPNILWAALLVFIVAVTWTLRAHSSRRADSTTPVIDHAWLNVSGAAALLGTVLVLIRPMVAGPLSARVWAVACTFCALLSLPLGWLEAHLARRGSTLGALARRRSLWQWLGVAAHVLGLTVLAIAIDQGVWLIAVALVAVTVASLGCRPRGLRLTTISPLLPVYALVTLSLVLEGPLAVDLAPYQAFPYPNPWSPWFDVGSLCAAGVLGTLWLTAAALWPKRTPRTRNLALLSAALAAAWFVTSTARHLTRGVTGSDPYCYLQMAADLVERGSLLHRFPLITTLAEAGLQTWLGVHVGYQVIGQSQMAPTVWPMGWPVLLAPLYSLFGEGAAYLAAPLWALVGAAATWRITTALCSRSGKRRFIAAGCAALVVVTSAEVFLRSIVPLADAASLALAVLTMLLLMRAHRSTATGRALAWWTGAGLAFGMAYLVRHPSLMLGVGVLPMVLDRSKPLRRRALGASAFGAAALLVAVPDLAYHARVFGSPWRAESPEWFLISVSNIPQSAQSMAKALLDRREFGYLVPMMGIGWIAQWKERGQRTIRWAMNLSWAAVLLFTLSYQAVRLRDLIPLFPWFAIWTGEGLALVMHWISRARPVLRATVLALLTLAVATRMTWFVSLPWSDQVSSFGLVTADQREAFDRLRDLCPPDAVILTGLNSGAAERYTGMPTLRPASLSPDAFDRVVQIIQPATILVLEDGEEMEDFVAALSTRDAYTLQPLGSVNIPRMGLGGQPMDGPARLYLLEAQN